MARFGRRKPHAPIYLRAPQAGSVAPPDAWAISATQGSTRPPAYAPKKSTPVAIYDPATNTFADWVPPQVISRASMPYGAPRSRSSMQPDASTNTFADWTPEPVVARATQAYAPPRSASVAASDNTAAAISPTVISAVQDATLRSYSPPRSQTITVTDPALNTFADWAQPPVTSRSTPLYTPPRSQTLAAPSSSVAPDSAVLAAASTITRLYTPPRSVSVSITDPALNTFADWVPPQVVSRSVLSYAAPRSQILTPSSIPDTAALPTTRASSPIRYYTGPRSQTLWLVDPALNTFADWAPEPVTSRLVPAYASPRSQVIAATSGPIDVVIFSPTLASSPLRFYAPPRSFTIVTSDQTPAFGAMAFTTQSPRKLGREPGTSWTCFYTDVQTIIVVVPIPFRKVSTLGGRPTLKTQGPTG